MIQKHSILLIVFTLTTNVDASVVQYTDRAQWKAAVGNQFETIDFTQYPQPTIITTQYSANGVIFTDGNDFIHQSSAYIEDGAGLNGNNPFNTGIITIAFSVQQHWIAADFPGDLGFRLYQGNTLIYTSPGSGGGGSGWFYGLVSDDWFNRAVLFGPTGPANVDTLFYNAAPVPSVLGLFAMGALLSVRRRRI